MPTPCLHQMWPIAVLMLDQRRRRWASIKTALSRYLMFPRKTEEKWWICKNNASVRKLLFSPLRKSDGQPHLSPLPVYPPPLPTPTTRSTHAQCGTNSTSTWSEIAWMRLTSTRRGSWCKWCTEPILVQCWPTICDVDPALKQQWVDV